MPKYSLTNKGNVVQCKWNCKGNHEHYIGSYEMAIKYFGIEENNIKSYGNLINVVIYQQTSQFTIPMFTNELYDKLINCMSEHKYWVPEKERDKKAKEILKEANKIGLIKDKSIYNTIKQKPDNLKAQKRLYFFKLWCEQNERYDILEDVLSI